MSTLDPKLVAKCMAEFQRMDEEVLIVLKAHLLIEERLNEILTKFVFHPSFLEKANLRFHQKVHVARSFSLDQQDNRMWDLILAINTLRNEMAHTLQFERRKQKTAAVMDIYAEVQSSKMATEGKRFAAHVRMGFAASYCIGFLGGFEKEVERYRKAVDTLDRVLNPHRHKKPSPSPKSS
jgi:hypothetical protein